MTEAGGRQPYRFAVLALACALAFMGNYLQYQVSALAVGVMAVLKVGTAGFQLLFLAPMLAAVFLSVPFGVLGDRFGPKRVVAVAFSVALAGSFLRLCDLASLPLQLGCMFAIGVGMTALTANNAKTLGLWFGAETEFAMGAYYASSCLGISAAQATAGLAGSIERSYLGASCILAVIVVLWIAFDRNMPKGVAIPLDARSAPPFSHAARSRSVWLIALCAGFTLAATTGFAGLLPQALELDRGMDTVDAGLLASLLTCASMVGCVVTPLLCARCKSARAYLGIVGAAGALVMAVTWFVPGHGAGLLALLLLNGFSTSMMGPILQAFPVMLPGIGTRFAGSAGGIIAEVSLLMSFALPVAVSAVAGTDYLVSFVMFGACYALALIPLCALPPLRFGKGHEGTEDL